MGIRKYTFGYEMRKGKIEPVPAEAEVVRMLHERYASGSSYRQLTALLNAGTVPYNEPDKQWNKNMVARILGNVIYIGNKDYPPILDEVLLRKVQEMKPDTGQTMDSRAKMIRSMCRCASCGRKPSMNSNAKGWQRWSCIECGALTSKATLQTVTKDLEKIIADLQVNPTLICDSQTELENQKRITQLEQELQEAMEKETFDDAKARRIVLELAQARLESCGAGEYETQRIRHYISAFGINELEQLVPQIVTAILIPVTGDIELLLKNGQTVRRSGSSCR